MGPKYDRDGGNDGEGGKWEYAGQPEFEWKTFKEHNNSKSGKSPFEYSDSTEKNIRKESEWPSLGYQELPEKE